VAATLVFVVYRVLATRHGADSNHTESFQVQHTSVAEQDYLLINVTEEAVALCMVDIQYSQAVEAEVLLVMAVDVAGVVGALAA
jgi:hypothetical protein